jgi:hypothetical protein
VKFFCLDNQRADEEKLTKEQLLDIVLHDVAGRELNQFLHKEVPINSGIIQNQVKKN